MRRSLNTLAKSSGVQQQPRGPLGLSLPQPTSNRVTTSTNLLKPVSHNTNQRTHYSLGTWFSMRSTGITAMEVQCEKDVEKGVDEFINSTAVDRVMKEVPFTPQISTVPIAASLANSAPVKRHYISELEDQAIKCEVKQILIQGELLRGTTSSEDVYHCVDRLENHIVKLPSLASNEKDSVNKMQMVLIALHMVKRYDVNHHQRRPTTQLLHGMLNQVCRPTDTQLIEHSFNEVLQDRHSSSVQRMVACNRLAQLYASSPLALDRDQAVRMLDRADEYMPSMKLTESNRQMVLKFPHGVKHSFSSSAAL